MKIRTFSNIIVIGASAGGLKALISLLSKLPAKFNIPMLIVQHTSPYQESLLSDILGKRSVLPVVEAEDKMIISPGLVIVAPPNYHMLVESDATVSLSTDEKVKYSRPSIDVLFESAAWVYGENTLGIILSGANDDGAKGIKEIKEAGGITLAQNPETAEFALMPQAAIETGAVDFILTIDEIALFIMEKNKSEN